MSKESLTTCDYCLGEFSILLACSSTAVDPDTDLVYLCRECWSMVAKQDEPIEVELSRVYQQYKEDIGNNPLGSGQKEYEATITYDLKTQKYSTYFYPRGQIEHRTLREAQVSMMIQIKSYNEV